MKRIVKRVALGLVAAIAAVLVAFGVLYASRIQTISSIDQVTSYDDGYNLYTMDVVYDYDLDALLARDIRDNQAFLDAAVARAHDSAQLRLHRLYRHGSRWRSAHGAQL